MSFLRRLSNAASSILPSVPNSAGIPAPHVPRRATETFRRVTGLDDLQEEGESQHDEVGSRASWELSDDESAGSSSGSSGRSGSSSGSSSARSSFDSETSLESSDSEVEADGRPKDRFDMMTRHLWNVGERQGWFRDADFDGLVSLR